MSQKTKIIHVEEDVWATLNKLKYELRLHNVNDVIKHLLQKSGYMDTYVPGDGK